LQEHLAITEKTKKETRRGTGSPKYGGKQGFIEGLMDKISGAHKCKGMEGIITEGQKIMRPTWIQM
jgi:hypothetical protein